MEQRPEILLGADTKAVTLRKIKETQQALATIADFLNRGAPFEIELASNVLRVSEFNIAEIGQLLGVETQTAVDIEKRFAEIRAANSRIRHLEAQLGDAQPPEATQMSLHRLKDRLEAWWRHEGLGAVFDLDFGPYGCKAVFSCHLYGDFDLVDSPTPVSDKERKAHWHQSLRERGLVLVQRDPGLEVADCDASRKALCDLVAAHMPSAQVSAFKNINRRGQGFTIQGIEVFVRRLDDILKLPVPNKTSTVTSDVIAAPVNSITTAIQ